MPEKGVHFSACRADGDHEVLVIKPSEMQVGDKILARSGRWTDASWGYHDFSDREMIVCDAGPVSVDGDGVCRKLGIVGRGGYTSDTQWHDASTRFHIQVTREEYTVSVLASERAPLCEKLN